MKDYDGKDPTGVFYFDPHDHDVLIERGEFYFYVRAIRRGESFRGNLETSLTETLWMIFMYPLVEWVREFFPWQVGVVRGPRSGQGNQGRIVLRGVRRLKRGEDPQPEIDRLVREVNDGKFDN